MTYRSRFCSQDVTELFEAMLTLKTVDEFYQFFDDLATVGELKSLAQRFYVAKKLMNKEKYTVIAGETGASTATISRVKRNLNYGADGYRMVLDRLEEKRNPEQKDGE